MLTIVTNNDFINVLSGLEGKWSARGGQINLTTDDGHVLAAVDFHLKDTDTYTADVSTFIDKSVLDKFYGATRFHKSG
jgi:hypothetical protein